MCRVDRGTYVGWRTFHGICHTCHAQDAVGSTFAPDLLARMRQIDKAEFMKALTEGFKGQIGVMPPWSQDPNVNKYFEELWSYLKARSDGVLLPVDPSGCRPSREYRCGPSPCSPRRCSPPAPAGAQAPRAALKVCADPNNLPFSNRA